MYPSQHGIAAWIAGRSSLSTPEGSPSHQVLLCADTQTCGNLSHETGNRRHSYGILPQMRRSRHLASILAAALAITAPLAALASAPVAAQAIGHTTPGAAAHAADRAPDHPPVPATREPQRTTAIRPQDTGFLNRVILLNGVSYRYVVYLPIEYDPHRAWPIILFLHGAGE